MVARASSCCRPTLLLLLPLKLSAPGLQRENNKLSNAEKTARQLCNSNKLLNFYYYYYFIISFSSVSTCLSCVFVFLTMDRVASNKTD